MSSASIEILMPVFNAAPVVAKSLSYLLYTGVAPEQIVVLDDCSDEDPMLRVAEWARSRGITWSRSDVNLGYTRNVNRGLHAVASEHALVVNSDCFVSSSTIAMMTQVLTRYAYLGCVGPLSSNAGHQTIQLWRDIRWNALSEDEIFYLSQSIEGQLRREFGGRPWLMPTVNGFCCLWRVSAIKEIGYFDDQEFPRGYGEEDDACLRLVDSGRFAAVLPFAFAPHLKTQSFSTKERTALKKLARNKLRMKFSSAYIDRLVKYYERNPLVGELRRITLGG